MPALESVQVKVTSERIDHVGDADWLISYGYKHILGHRLLSSIPGRAINLHISLLPWNRGYDPNFWSWVDDTPKGVSIHVIDEGVDTGPLLAQRSVSFSGSESLSSSYDVLRTSVESLFIESWPGIRDGEMRPVSQQSGGSHHFRRERLAVFSRLPAGWDTPAKFVRDAVSAPSVLLAPRRSGH